MSLTAIWIEAKPNKPAVTCFKNQGCVVTEPGGQLLKVSVPGMDSRLYCVECGPDAISAVAMLGGTVGKPKVASKVATSKKTGDYVACNVMGCQKPRVPGQKLCEAHA